MALQGTATGQRQKVNRGDTLITLLKLPTNEKAMWRGREKEASRYLPQHFFVWPRFSYSCSCIFFTKYDTPKKTNKQTKSYRRRLTFAHLPGAHLTTVPHVLQRRVRSGYEPRFFWQGIEEVTLISLPTTVTAKPKTSRRKRKHHGETENLNGKNKIPHGKTKYFTATTK